MPRRISNAKTQRSESASKVAQVGNLRYHADEPEAGVHGNAVERIPAGFDCGSAGSAVLRLAYASKPDCMLLTELDGWLGGLFTIYMALLTELVQRLVK